MKDISLVDNQTWPPEIKNDLRLPHVKGIIIGQEGNNVVLKTPWMRWHMVLTWLAVSVIESIKLYALWSLLGQLSFIAGRTVQAASIQGRFVNEGIVTVAFIAFMGVAMWFIYTFRFQKGRFVLNDDTRSIEAGNGFNLPFSDVIDVNCQRIIMAKKYEIVINYQKRLNGSAKVGKLIIRMPLNAEDAFSVANFITRAIGREPKIVQG